MLISHCSNCGIYFKTRSFSIRDSESITFEGCRETCVNCGHEADVLDGTYTDVGGVTSLVAAPWATVEKIYELQQILKELAEKRISEPEAVRAAEKISPEAGRAVRDWINTGVGLGGLVVMAMALGLQYKAYKQSSPLTDTELKMRIEQVLSEEESTQKEQNHVHKMPEREPGQKNRKERRAEKAKHRTERKGR